MAEIIPSFFSRLDFWITLLPGYIALILGLLLLSPDILWGQVYGSNGPLSDLFLIVVFIVAGPAIGITLWQFYVQVVSVGFSIFRYRGRKHEFLRAYSDLKMRLQDTVKAELDGLEAQYQFFVSTGIAIIAVDALYSLLSMIHFKVIPGPSLVHISTNSSSSQEVLVNLGESILVFEVLNDQIVLIVALFAAATILILSAYHYNQAVRLPIICALIKKYDLHGTTESCRENEKHMAKIYYIKAKNMVKKPEKRDKQIGIEYLAKAVSIDKDYVNQLYKEEKNRPFMDVEHEKDFISLDLPAVTKSERE